GEQGRGDSQGGDAGTTDSSDAGHGGHSLGVFGEKESRRSPVVAERGAVARVAGGGPGDIAEGGAEEADAAVAEADVHAGGVPRLSPGGVARGHEVGLDLKLEHGRVAGAGGSLVVGVGGEDRPPDAVGVGPQAAVEEVEVAAGAAGGIVLRKDN